MTTEYIKEKFLTEELSSTELLCLPIDKKGKQLTISEDLNSSSYYLLIDFKKKSSIYLSLNEIQEAFEKSNGNGFKELGITSIICKGIAPMALKILIDSEISVWLPSSNNLEENIELFLSKKLRGFAANDASKSGCNSSCSTCNTECR